MKEIVKDYSSQGIINRLNKSGKHRKKTKVHYVEIYPMMPRRYTYLQRAELRKFERELLQGQKINIG